MARSPQYYHGRIAVLQLEITSRIDDAHNEHAKDCKVCDLNEAAQKMALASMEFTRDLGREIMTKRKESDAHYHLPDTTKPFTDTIDGGMKFTCDYCENEVSLRPNSPCASTADAKD